VTSTRDDLERVLVSELALWGEGPPHELFRRLRAECPVHWTSGVPDHPGEPGFWSVTRPEDIHAVSRDWRTYSSERGGITSVGVFPLELIRSRFIGMDPPRHDRLKMLFQAGFTPRRIAAHEGAIRAIVRGVLDRLDGREACDLVSDVAQPVVSRVIGSFMGVPPEDDAHWARLMNSTLAVADPDMSPRGVDTLLEDSIPEVFERCRRLIAERRERPTDDLTSVLVHADVEGEKLDEQEIVMGFFLLMAAGNDSTKACFPPSPTSRGRRPGTRSSVDSRFARARRWSCGTRPQAGTRLATRTRIASTCAAIPSTRRSAPVGAISASAPRWRGSSFASRSRRRCRAIRAWSSRASPRGSRRRSSTS
jgi:hypothetical protein